MAIRVTVVEEHHEAFFVWMEARNAGVLPAEGNALIHVDEHSDLALPHLQHSLQALPTEPRELRAFTYSQLSIGNFIFPTVYLGLFGEIYWIQHLAAQGERQLVHIYSDRGLGKALLMANSIHRAGVFNRDRRHVWYRKQRVSDELPSLESVVLDIDLDYFSCADTSFVQRLEVTASEHARLVGNPYHPLRLHYGNMVRGIREDGRCFVEVAVTDGPGEVGFRVSEGVVRQRLDALADFLRRETWTPRLVTVCRSRFSGYTPEDQIDFIQSGVLQTLADRYDIQVEYVSAVPRTEGAEFGTDGAAG